MSTDYHEFSDPGYPYDFEAPTLDQTGGWDFGGTWGWDGAPWSMWCLACWDRYEEDRLDCVECANTRRFPLPFEEMWGIVDGD